MARLELAGSVAGVAQSPWRGDGDDGRRAPALSCSRRRRRRGAPSRRPCPARGGGAGGVCSSAPRRPSGPARAQARPRRPTAAARRKNSTSTSPRGRTSATADPKLVPEERRTKGSAPLLPKRPRGPA